MQRPVCVETGKVCYHSKHEARTALAGQLRSKSVRIYQCTFHQGHWHLTTKWRTSIVKSAGTRMWYEEEQ